MRTRPLLPALSLGLLFALAAETPAQVPCPQVGVAPYGQSCATVFGIAPKLEGSFDDQTCSLTLAWTSFPGCCNSFLTGHLLLVGLQQANIPAPPPWQQCTIYVQPALVVALPAQADQLTVPVPPLPPGALVSAFFQVVDVYFTTIGFSTDYQFTNGLAVKAGA